MRQPYTYTHTLMLLLVHLYSHTYTLILIPRAAFRETEKAKAIEALAKRAAAKQEEHHAPSRERSGVSNMFLGPCDSPFQSIK